MHGLLVRCLAILGGLLLIVAMLSPWMLVPDGFATRPDGTLICTSREPRSAILYRAICGVFAIVSGFGHAWRRRTSDRETMLAATALCAQLFFPCTVMVWEPRYSARANWLQIQHENLTWLGGDLSTNLEYSRKGWKDWVYLVDTPRRINVIRVPTSGLQALQIGWGLVWFETLGYSNRFCQFVNRGWIAALAGMSCLVLSECLPDGRLNRGRVARVALAGVTTCLVGMAAVAVPVLFAAQALERARDGLARGYLKDAEISLNRAIRFLPSLREDTFYVAQWGLIDFRLQREDSLAGRLFFANLLERRGRFAEASDHYARVLDDAPIDSALRREAVRALLRFGTRALNAGQFERSREWLERVMHEEPCNLKANYALQLAYLKCGQRADIERLVRRIELEYAYFQMPSKAIVLALSHENELFAALREGDSAAAFRFNNRTKRP